MKKILIIDDEPEICTHIAEFLKESGFETFVAHRGSEGFEMAMTILPDLVILDVALPDIDGTSVYEGIRKNPQTKHIKVIFLTALADGAPEQFLGIDRSDYTLLSKPVQLMTILEEIQRLLET